MKSLPILCITALLQFAGLKTAGQPYMYLDESLKVAAKPMPAKRKGMGAVGKYEFGPYRILSGKAAWTTTKEKSGFVSGDTQIESKTKKSFVFRGPGNDTVTANISISSFMQLREQYGFIFRTLTGWSDQVVTESQESFYASFRFSSDTGVWNLLLVYPVGEELEWPIRSDMMDLFKGVFSNNQTDIDIEPVFLWENGEPATMFKPVEGYRFLLNGMTVAAVQVLPAQKITAWIRPDLPDHLRLALAAGVAALMVRSN